MLEQVLLVSLFTFIIHLSETLTYSLRLAGVRLGKLAVALSLSGIILLISRTANMLQGPLTGNILDFAKHNAGYNIMDSFQMIIGAATLGTFTALLLFPSAVLLSSRIISHLEVAGSIPQMILSSVSLQKIKHARVHLRFPKLSMLSRLRIGGIPKRLVVLNVVVTAMATILLTLLIDPQIGLITDKVLRGEKEVAALSKVFGLLMLSRLLGTILAQVLLLPAAYWIHWMVSVL
ncbi:lipid II flippase family protein [Paenibacillus wynnii]|uniref:lipid II flippase family protein n=1 Tax=Paenibacillus wynnii TaxID=268407 RepID=UPI00278CD0B9|nr:DUF2837 family protein [Paenibacillus wynnii]MDQ0196346.1 hypothetical protein [Paenibacillus wynnii]